MDDILLIEDQEELAQLLQVFFKRDGLSVIHKATGEEAVEYLQEHQVKVVLLDIMLPEMDGFAVCRAIREKGNTPILILSARTDKTDQLNGFELGADDYIEKPADPDILSARVKALIQRSYGNRHEADLLKSGEITIDRSSRKVYLRTQLLKLNVKEYELLLLLALNPGKTLHKEYIFNQIWGTDSESEEQTLTVHIKWLRMKIEENPRKPVRIRTVWGIGYRYEEV